MVNVTELEVGQLDQMVERKEWEAVQIALRSCREEGGGDGWEGREAGEEIWEKELVHT